MNLMPPEQLIPDDITIRLALKERMIYLTDQIDDISVFDTIYLLDRIVALDKKWKKLHPNEPLLPITIKIRTPGGVVYSGLALMGVINKMQNQGYIINTECEGYAMSMGIPILLCGSHRTATKYSKMMFHQASSGAEGRLGDLQISFKETETLQKFMFDYIVKHSKLDLEFIETKTTKGDWFFDADEALLYGIIDEIV